MNLLFTSPQPYTLILSNLFRENGWNPVYFFVKEEFEDEIQKQYPNVITHNYIDAVKGIPPEEFKNLTLEEIDPDILNILSSKEHTVLSMMDRNDSNSNTFSYKDRLNFYYYLVQYWQTILKKLDLSIVIFEEEPHQANDYVLYLVCGILKIKTLMSVRTISNLGILPMEKFEIGCEPFLDAYKESLSNNHNIQNLEFSSNLENYYAKLSGNYESILSEHLWDQVDQIKDQKSKPFFRFSGFFKIFWAKALDFHNHYKRILFVLNQNYISDQKEKRKPLNESNLGYLKAVIYKVRTIYKKSVNKRYYESIAIKEIDFSTPYIFCGLQYQPEKSTCPLGGRFNDQILMIELLAKNLPNGWNLYVKEHPSQFVNEYSRYGELFRSKKYYDTIKNIPNVYLVSLKSDVFNLIDQSKAVASVTGTICWEAAFRGKASLNFGYSWLKGCEGIFEIFNKEDLLKAVSLIKNDYFIDTNKVKLFGKIIDELDFKAAVGGPSQLDYKNILPEQNAKILFNSYMWLIGKKNLNR